jgi:glucitol operon activator protein
MTYFQVKHYQSRIRELRKKGAIGIGTVKGKLRAGIIIIILAVKNGHVADAEIMKGYSVFARFKRIPGLVGKRVNKLLEHNFNLSKAEKKALEIAVKTLTENHSLEGELQND